jgi:hypothetical protein
MSDILPILKDFLTKEDPFDETTARLLDDAFSTVLKELGIPEGNSAEVQARMAEKEVKIRELIVENAPQIDGFYFYQGESPVSYISYPFLNEKRQLVVKILNFRKEREEERKAKDFNQKKEGQYYDNRT